MPGAREALARLREAGVPVAVVSNQSGIARGLLAHEDVAAIHARMEELLGPLGPLEYCPHGPDDGCACRKPAPGLILRAAERLGVDPRACVVVGDIGGDVEAARAAGADAVLVPTARTRTEEIAAAPRRARDLTEAPSTCCVERGMTHVLAVRLDNDGDVLLAGPAIRAVAAGADRVTLLCGPRGRQAAELLPGVDEVVCWRAPWIDPEPAPVDSADVLVLAARLAALEIDRALIFGSFHQSPLPTALLLRLAHVPVDRRDLGRLPRLAARPPPPRAATTSTRSSATCRSPPRPASRHPRTIGCASKAREPLLREFALRRRAPRGVRPGTGVGAGAQRGAGAGAARARARRGGHGRAGRDGADRARGRSARRDRSRGTDDAGRAGGGHRRRGRDRRRQHRPGASRGRGRDAGGLALRADRPGRALAPVARSRTSCCTWTCCAPDAARGRARWSGIRV